LTDHVAGTDAHPAPEPGADPNGIDRYRQIYDGVALPVVMIDAATWTIVAVNEAAVDQYGYSGEEFVGLPVLELRPPEGRAEAHRVMSEMPHGFWKTSAVRHQRKDGSVFSADVWSRDTVVDGRAVRIATVSDVTERVQLQHELQQAQKMEAVGQLAGGIAHDFNNVLTTIIGGTELLMERVGDDPATLGELEDIRGVASRAAALTRQLLAFSRQQVMRVDIVALGRVVARAEAMLTPLMEARVEVRTDVEEGTWPVRVDAGQMEQVIVNLAVNAQDAMPDGGVFSMATRNRVLEGDARVGDVLVPAGDYVELTLRDTGVGMDEMTRARVFEPFFTTKPPPGGTGLGLSVAYGIVRQLGGFMSVDSAAGHGATFRILLPRAETRAAVAAVVPATSAPAPRVPSAEGRRTVLLVEDDDALRRVGTRVLERLGFTVLSAAGGGEALALVEASRPALDLVVTDLVMPGMDGMEVASALSDLSPGVPVLFVSGYSDEAAGRLGMLGPGRAFLQKPYSMESIAEAVRALLEEG